MTESRRLKKIQIKYSYSSENHTESSKILCVLFQAVEFTDSDTLYQDRRGPVWFQVVS
jgi:hypothetical protein